MNKQNEKGFTIVELIIAMTVFSLFANIILLSHFKARENAKEAESKLNLYQIHIALKRYAVDHNGQYPKMIWGGDKRGWSTTEGVGCRTMWQHQIYDGTNERTAHPPLDPLISFGYLESYPRNPFINEGAGPATTIRWTNPVSPKLGDGDPRFGYSGEIMGNTIEDPRYLWSGPNQPTRIRNCFLSEGSTYYIEMISPRTPANPFYTMGGIPDWQRFTSDTSSGVAISDLESGVTLNAYWPGMFFYRSAGTFLFPESFLFTDKPNPNLRTIWDFNYSKIDKYMLGVYGSHYSDGMDVIRLTDKDGRIINNLMGHYGGGNYEPHPSYPRTETTRVLFSSPEVFGGGEKGRMPYFPYTNPETDDWLFGAPDGYNDGVILVLTSFMSASGE